jgi:predicted ATPase
MAGNGRAAEGLAQALSGFEAVGAAGQEVFRPYYTGILADMCRLAGQMDEGITLVDKALDLASSHDSPWCLPELHRIKGELTLARGESAAAAEPCFETAITTARERSAKSWELRAATSLARLRRSQGKSAEARDVLAPVYGWFCEGFDSADLKNAKTVLDQLTNAQGPSGGNA